MKKNQVTKVSFLNWYFSDSDDIKSMGYEVYQCLIGDDAYHITVEDLFSQCGYIPQSICVTKGNAEYDPSEVELID